MDRAYDATPLVDLLDERRHLLELAYRMLGSTSAAESVIAETYRRWYELPGPARARIEAPGPWLADVAGSICRARLAGTGPGNGRAAQPEEKLGHEVGAMLRRALRSFSPAERASFMLNEVFGIAPGAAAGTVAQPEDTEQTHTAFDSPRPRRSPPPGAQRQDEVAHAFRRACLTEDEALLESLLAPGSTAVFDGGGKVRALVTPVHGSRQVTRTLLTLLPSSPRTSLQTRDVNGLTGLVVYSDRQVAAVISLGVTGRRIQRICVILNPDKLSTWSELDDGAPS
ncbi:RNA polymerase subunit sigma [Streptomyces sp. NPDC059861]|uniref:RNA polymerase subunit sigma n=1 Tax=Streptomyces sp. NPDC059861 TaxID=3346974 RepID=UPI0036642897